MDVVHFRCPHCDHQITVQPSDLGTEVMCANCGRSVRIAEHADSLADLMGRLDVPDPAAAGGHAAGENWQAQRGSPRSAGRPTAVADAYGRSPYDPRTRAPAHRMLRLLGRIFPVLGTVFLGVIGVRFVYRVVWSLFSDLPEPARSLVGRWGLIEGAIAEAAVSAVVVLLLIALGCLLHVVRDVAIGHYVRVRQGVTEPTTPERE